MKVKKTLLKLRNHICRKHYLIMKMKLADSGSETGNSKIFWKQMAAEDCDRLSTEYFCEKDHTFKKEKLMHHDPLFSGFMFYSENGETVGYCWIMRRGSRYPFFKISHTDAYVSEFYVDSKVRNCGYGAAMLAMVSRILQEEGMKELSLAVQKSNCPAIRCYQKVGFVQTRELHLFQFFNWVYPHYEL